MRTVLIVDDEADILLVLELLLCDQGYRVITATDGADALQKANEDKPDFILSDQMMPGMDGIGLFWALQAIPLMRDIPMVMMSAVEIPVALRTQGFLHKPFDFKELTRLVQLYVPSDA